MQFYNRFNIPNIARKLDSILAAQHLRPEVTPGVFIREHVGKKHRYATICTNPAKNKIIFYGRLHANDDACTKFRREIIFLRKSFSAKSPLTPFLPQVYNSSLTTNAEWFTREYLDVPVIGSIHATTTALTTKDVPHFVQLFSALQHIPKLKLQSIEMRGGDFYLTLSEASLKTASRFFTQMELRAIRHILHASFEALSDNATHLVHGDCHPGNILYNRKRMYIIDWELLHQNNRTNDIAYFFAGLAECPRFANALIRAFEKRITWKKEFRQLFPVTAMFFGINHLCTLQNGRPKELSQRKANMVIHYCKHIVRNACLGYTHLVK